MRFEKIDLKAYAAYLRPRARDWHKGLSGRVLVIGGELGFSGAPRLAAEAALRVGAGLVSVLTRPENAIVMNLMRPEIMCHGITDSHEATTFIEKTNVIVLGPGLGQSKWSKALFQHISRQTCPIVLDADGLNLLAQDPAHNDNWILTPHAGEAARLLDTIVQTVQENRLTSCLEIQKRYGGVCVLKGEGSLVLAPNSVPALCDKGNPGMATAGMGDVLSGVIGGLIAQGIPLAAAAKLGVCMHATAGDIAAARQGERGMLASDLMPYLRLLSNPTEESRH